MNEKGQDLEMRSWRLFIPSEVFVTCSSSRGCISRQPLCRVASCEQLLNDMAIRGPYDQTLVRQTDANTVVERLLTLEDQKSSQMAFVLTNWCLWRHRMY